MVLANLSNVEGKMDIGKYRSRLVKILLEIVLALRFGLISGILLA
jgi:hypothetical protein